MLIERGRHGQWVVSDIIDGHLVSHQYYGYTKREAVREFKEEAKSC